MYRTLARLAWWFAIAGGLVAGAVALMVVSSVTLRALLTRPIPGDVELTQFGIALCISLCLPWCQYRGANIIVDFFTQKAPRRVNRALDAVRPVGSLMKPAVYLTALAQGRWSLMSPLDDSPLPIGIAVETEPSIPVVACSSRAIAATYRAQRGSMDEGSTSTGSGTDAGAGSSAEASSMRPGRGAPSMTVHRSMAIGRTRPPV